MRLLQVWLHMSELFMFLVFISQWAAAGATSAGDSSERERQVQRFLPFATNAALAGFALVGAGADGGGRITGKDDRGFKANNGV